MRAFAIAVVLVGFSAASLANPSGGPTGGLTESEESRASQMATMIDWPEPNRPGFVVFHQDYRPDGYGEGKPEDQAYFPKPMIEEYIRGVLVHPKNFLGLIDQFDDTLQFYANDDGTVLIDFIVKGKNGSMQKIGTVDECISLVRATGPSLSLLVIPGAKFTAW